MIMRGGGMGGGGWGTFIRHDDEQAQPQITGALIRRVLSYALPYRGRIILMLVTILLATLVALIPPLLYQRLIDQAIPHAIDTRDLSQLNLLALGMIGIPILSGLLGVFQRYLSSQVGEGLIFNLRSALFEHLQRMPLRFFTNTRTGEIMSRLNNDVVGAQQAVTGTFISLITNVIALVATLAIMITLEWRLTLLSIAILPLFILPARRVARILRDLTRQQMTLNGQMSALMNETLNVSGALLVKIFGRAGEENARFRDRAAKVRDVGIRQTMVGRWFFLGLSLVSAIGTAIVFWWGAFLVVQGEFSVGMIVAFGAYLSQLYGPISSLTNARVEIATSMVSFERVFEVLDLKVEIDDKPGAIDLDDVTGRVEFDDVSFSYVETGSSGPTLAPVKRWSSRDDVEVASRVPASSAGGSRRSLASNADLGATTSIALPPRFVAGPAEVNGGPYDQARPTVAPLDRSNRESGDVSHDPRAGGHRFIAAGNGPESSREESEDEIGLAPPGEGNGRRWALQNVSFVVEPGQLAALVGPSGAGKTTITYLLPRLYDPTSGQIRIDGHNLRDVTLASLTRQIGMVTQETYLFHDTVRANLLYARSDATQEEMEQACRAANIHELIADLPDGYDTIVGERGYRLSGGEKQRVAIARVILKDPRILVLDEATSHLDSQSEALIQTALTRVMKGRTSLVIAHRLSTILAADVILVIDKGGLVERGTHAELLAGGGLYAKLFETQFLPAGREHGPT